jgi:hypothetical protein
MAGAKEAPTKKQYKIARHFEPEIVPGTAESEVDFSWTLNQ